MRRLCRMRPSAASSHHRSHRGLPFAGLSAGAEVWVKGDCFEYEEVLACRREAMSLRRDSPRASTLRKSLEDTTAAGPLQAARTLAALYNELGTPLPSHVPRTTIAHGCFLLRRVSVVAVRCSDCIPRCTHRDPCRRRAAPPQPPG